MRRMATDDPILTRLRTDLGEAYGTRLDRAILFGSRARGEARSDSDYDVAVFLREMHDHALELDRLADLGLDIFYDTGEFVRALPFFAGAYDDPRMPLMHEIRREGVDFGSRSPPRSWKSRVRFWDTRIRC